MKIQLPADKGERKKILFMIGLFSVGILYAIVAFGIVPFRARVRADRDRLAELEDLLWQAERDIQQIPRNRDRMIETIDHLLRISQTEQYILQPRLGNYLLVAEAILEEISEQVGVPLHNIRETSGPPPQRDDSRNELPAFWPYAVSFSLETSIHDLLRFVHALQNDNPYITILNITVSSGSPNGPASHVVNATVQWPVWKDVERPNRLSAERLTADEEQ